MATPVQVGVPDPGPDWLPATVEAWEGLWCSDLASVVEETDRDAVRRLFQMRDMQARCWARYELEPYVNGSKGQPVANPAMDDALRLEKAIVALEDRIGLTPKARANLGIAVGQARLTAAALNEQVRSVEASGANDPFEEGQTGTE